MTATYIANRYYLHELLGAGGMGTVYRGTDSHNNMVVAVKHLKPELTHPDMIERFIREGRALRDLNHPNIVKILDEIEENGDHYLIMDYLPGGDLYDLLEQGPPPVERCLKLAIEIADALTRAHHLNIVHRDLKPANILLGDDDTPHLTDFGVAHIADKKRITDTDNIVGTVDYLAPEVLRGERIDPRVDIWSFGVMLFEMLVGKRPFTGSSVGQVLVAIMTEPVPDLEALCPEAPLTLVDLVYRMLDKDRNSRIRSVRHIGAELEDILHGRSDSTPPPTRFASPLPASFSRPKHNLPAQTTPFVGREAELRELTKLLDDPNIRLITILAPGGMGKSRLALELANNYVHDDVGALRMVCISLNSRRYPTLPTLSQRLPKRQATNFRAMDANRNSKSSIFCETKTCSSRWTIMNICWMGQGWSPIFCRPRPMSRFLLPHANASVSPAKRFFIWRAWTSRHGKRPKMRWNMPL